MARLRVLGEFRLEALDLDSERERARAKKASERILQFTLNACVL
jgi:hypothetical protein